jgi:hypothetical protein
MGQRDFSVSVVIKMTALKMVDGWCKGFPSVMDQTNTEPTIEKPAPKKTLREVYANAASGLLLMNESVTEELRESKPRQEWQKMAQPKDETAR